MNLVHYKPHHSLRRSSDRNFGMFNDLFEDFSPLFLTGRNSAIPADSLDLKVDIYQKSDVVIIEAELPGVEKEDIRVDVKGKHITLVGERKFATDVKEENCYRRERRYGRFERTFSMPFEVNSDAVKANFNNGLLKLEIAKPEEQVVKKIAIN